MWHYLYFAHMLSGVQLFDPMDSNPPDCSVHGILPGKNSGVGFHFLFQGIFPTQGSNLHLLCLCIGRQILSHCAPWEALICILHIRKLKISEVK